MNEILHGDCLDVLKTLENDSIDLIVTDPPYGYSFMGKSWDKALPSVDIWKECLRVLKPGAFAFIMSAPRSDVLSRMIVRIEDAGFRVDFTPIYWTYASGFPKATNMAKAIDKRAGIEREVVENRKVTENMAKMSKQSPNKAGYPKVERPKDNYWTGKILSKKAVSDQAKALDGSYAGFQPKPAVEVILIAMKPLSEKTFVDQALKNGKGITWLDDCRIPSDTTITTNGHPGGKWNEFTGKTQQPYFKVGEHNARFPANLLVSDDVLNDGRVMKDTGHFPKAIKTNSTFESGHRAQDERHMTGGGSYSRYFDLDAWAQTLPFLIVPKASKREKNEGLEHLPDTNANRENAALTHAEGRTASTKNAHPTVKPLTLMSYLITLGSRPGDIVLDPFVGSGTTTLAAKLLGRKYIGIEKEKEYLDIAIKRMDSNTLPI